MHLQDKQKILHNAVRACLHCDYPCIIIGIIMRLNGGENISSFLWKKQGVRILDLSKGKMHGSICTVE